MSRKRFSEEKIIYALKQNENGKPVDNFLIGSFNGRLCNECLNIHLFWPLEDARAKLEEWRLDYNMIRPHSALGQLTPEEYSASVCGEGICRLKTGDP